MHNNSDSADDDFVPPSEPEICLKPKTFGKEMDYDEESIEDDVPTKEDPAQKEEYHRFLRDLFADSSLSVSMSADIASEQWVLPSNTLTTQEPAFPNKIQPQPPKPLQVLQQPQGSREEEENDPDFIASDSEAEVGTEAQYQKSISSLCAYIISPTLFQGRELSFLLQEQDSLSRKRGRPKSANTKAHPPPTKIARVIAPRPRLEPVKQFCVAEVVTVRKQTAQVCIIFPTL